MENLIEVKDLCKDFVNGSITTQVLHNISFDMKKGEFISIIGPSGSGKSTLLYLLGALDKPTNGYVKIGGQEIVNLNDNLASKERRKRIGFVFQFYNLIPNFTAEENILLPVMLDGVKIKEKKELAKELLDIVGLYEKRMLRPKQLSGGQQQRVAIARALINNPDIILADEAIGNLDQTTGIEIMSLLQKLNQEKGVSIIQVTHALETCSYGTRVIKIVDGRINSDESL